MKLGEHVSVLIFALIGHLGDYLKDLTLVTLMPKYGLL